MRSRRGSAQQEPSSVSDMMSKIRNPLNLQLKGHQNRTEAIWTHMELCLSKDHLTSISMCVAVNLQLR